MGVKVQFWKGAWWIVVHHGGRRKTKRIGRDRDTAQRVAHALRAKLTHGDLNLDPPVEAHTLQHYAKDWLAVMKPALKASTHAHYDSTLRRYILPLLGTRQVTSIKRADCRQLVAMCRTKGLKVVTVRGIARTLSTLLSQAVEDELLPANPALRMGKYLRHGDEPAPDIRPFTRDEVASMLAVTRTKLPEWYPWLLC